MNQKKSQRENFRQVCLQRDRRCCVLCGFHPENLDELDVHHITDRNLMPFGGYVLPNGITLCTDRSKTSPNCHRKAESFHEKGVLIQGYTPTDLYAKIKSSHRQAYQTCLKDHLENTILDKKWQEFKLIHEEELVICLILECKPTEITWSLACENLGINDPLFEVYAKGRLYATDNGTERCHQENDDRNW